MTHTPQLEPADFRSLCESVLTTMHKSSHLLGSQQDLLVRLDAERRHLRSNVVFLKRERLKLRVIRGESSPLPRPIQGGSGLLRSWTEELPDAVVLHVEGEVDLACAGLFRRSLREAAQHQDRLIVDLTDAVYFDLSGVRAIEECLEQCTGNGGSLALVASNPIYRMLKLASLDHAIPIFNSLFEAIEFQRRRAG